jgi:D-proline reductase (dithiol) PrdB
MPRLSELDPESAEFIRNFRCLSVTDTPWTPLPRALDQCTVALVTSSGLRRQSDTPFDLSNPGGDPSFRIIPADVLPEELTLSIISANWDRTGFARDVNVVFPLDRLRELAAEGIIGRMADENYAFMGSIFKFDPMVEESAPEVGRRLKAAGVDVALLAPV